jgi:hypothetical protein
MQLALKKDCRTLMNFQGPLTPRCDITSKSGLFGSLFEYTVKLKRFLLGNAGEIWIKIYLNPKEQLCPLLNIFLFYAGPEGLN